MSRAGSPPTSAELINAGQWLEPNRSSAGVEVESIHHARYDAGQQLNDFVQNGGTVLACGTCIKARNQSSSDVCPISTMNDCLYMTLWAERSADARVRRRRFSAHAKLRCWYVSLAHLGCFRVYGDSGADRRRWVSTMPARGAASPTGRSYHTLLGPGVAFRWHRLKKHEKAGSAWSGQATGSTCISICESIGV